MFGRKSKPVNPRHTAEYHEELGSGLEAFIKECREFREEQQRQWDEDKKQRII